jgi:hypothetical protein
MAWAVPRHHEAFSLDKSSKATKSFKDDKHLAFIRLLPSCISGERPCDAAHISAGNPLYNKKRTGGAQKASDCWTVPLTRREHEAQTNHGDELAWWRSHGIDPFELAIKLYEVSGDVAAGTAIILKARKP